MLLGLLHRPLCPLPPLSIFPKHSVSLYFELLVRVGVINFCLSKEYYLGPQGFVQFYKVFYFILYNRGGDLVLSQSATMFMLKTTNRIASLNNRNNRGLDVTYDEPRCKHISLQLPAAKPLTLKSTRCTTF